MSCVVYPHSLVPNVFGWMNDTCGLAIHITWYHNGSHTKRVDCETTGLLKTGLMRHDCIRCYTNVINNNIVSINITSITCLTYLFVKQQKNVQISNNIYMTCNLTIF